MTHLVTEVKGVVWTAGCGEVARSVAGRRPDGFSVWQSDVDCVPCLERSRRGPSDAVPRPCGARGDPVTLPGL